MYITGITERADFESCLSLLDLLRAEISDGGVYDTR
jgi:hypothetical protein